MDSSAREDELTAAMQEYAEFYARLMEQQELVNTLQNNRTPEGVMAYRNARVEASYCCGQLSQIAARMSRFQFQPSDFVQLAEDWMTVRDREYAPLAPRDAK